MKNLSFEPQAWEDYLYWQGNDKIILKKINSLIKETLREPFFGIGKPEALKNDLAGFWSRRIDGEHRLIYAVINNELVIVQCRHRY